MQSFLKSGKLGTTSSKPSTSTTQVSERKQITPWVEKYRPANVDDIVEQKEAVLVLKECLHGADLPNLLLYGPPGTGKTSTILAAAKQLFGNMYKERTLELNASDERGIQVIRNKVKTFAQLAASGTRPDGTPCPPFKIIILDEADSMTHAAQAALRRTMESELRSTRFCLICNYVSRIIEPLTSRCTKFRFKPLGGGLVIERLRFVCDREEVNCKDEVLDAMSKASKGDLRKAITGLQSMQRLRNGNEVRVEDVYEVTGVIPDEYVRKFYEICKSNNYKELENYVNNFILDAYSSVQFLEQLNDILIETDEFTDKQKAIIGDKIGLVSFRLQGASEKIQLLDLGCAVISATRHR